MSKQSEAKSAPAPTEQEDFEIPLTGALSDEEFDDIDDWEREQHEHAQLANNTAVVAAYREAETIKDKMAAQLLVAEAGVRDASEKLDAAALQSGGTFSPAVASAKVALQTAKDSLDVVARAKKGAEEKFADAKRIQQRAARANLRKSIDRKLKVREAAASLVGASIEQLNSGWVALHKANADLSMSYPGQLPGGSLVSPGDVQRAVETELYRIGGNPFVGGIPGKSGLANHVPPLPGADKGVKTGRREDLPTLSAAMEQANAHILKQLDGE